MPAVSKKQQMFMGAEMSRMRAGKKSKTGMSMEQVKDFASTPRKGLPTKARSGKFGRGRRTRAARSY